MNQKSSLHLIAESWLETKNTAHDTDEILRWIQTLNDTIQVDIRKISLEECRGWRYDTSDGTLHNANRSFFSVAGMRQRDGAYQQPIILQNEIGYLGILCKEINGVMHFLMQAKIEPGNINKIQLSPTIQATKSNFTQQHGGKQPAYLDYFLHAEQHEIVVDQIQSEQAGRFWKKRNRNILVRIDCDIEVLPSHRWMTLGQIKRLMTYDNLVNMDTRTVLSCIPFCAARLGGDGYKKLESQTADKSLLRSVFYGDGANHLPELYRFLNNYKMFCHREFEFVPLMSLENWHMKDNAFQCRDKWPFRVVFCDISIEGREVRQWTQPLFEAIGIATFGLLCCEENGVLKFVVAPRPEVGCYDEIELGPTIQQEPGECATDNEVTRLFYQKWNDGEGVLFDTLLSEEGGRFYHEQNRNVILRVDREELGELPDGYFLIDYFTLNQMIQINNTVNIQLRNLLSVLEVSPC